MADGPMLLPAAKGDFAKAIGDIAFNVHKPPTSRGDIA